MLDYLFYKRICLCKIKSFFTSPCAQMWTCVPLSEGCGWIMKGPMLGEHRALNVAVWPLNTHQSTRGSWPRGVLGPVAARALSTHERAGGSLIACDRTTCFRRQGIIYGGPFMSHQPLRQMFHLLTKGASVCELNSICKWKEWKPQQTCAFRALIWKHL